MGALNGEWFWIALNGEVGKGALNEEEGALNGEVV